MNLQNSTPPSLHKKFYTSCMDALDDVGWDYGFSFSAYGVEIGIRFSDRELFSQLQSRLPYGCKQSSSKVVERLFSVVAIHSNEPVETRYNLYWDHMLFALKLSITEFLDRFESFALLAFAELSRERLFVHSGVVEWKGKAILLPGKSFSGKSTLVEALVRCGATYFSDELAVIDDQGFVSAYPRPLSLRESSSHQKRGMTLECASRRTEKRSLPVGIVVSCQYKNDANREPQQISSGNGLLILLENTHSAQREPVRAMQTLKNVVTNAKIIYSPQGEATEVAPKILQELAC